MRNVYSVSQVNQYIKKMFAEDYILHAILVRGEVSNCKYHSSGHIYFTLKDASGTISCVMFAGRRRGLSFRMKEGDQVIVAGTVDVYERDGRYQLYADRIILDGVGLLNARYEELKRRLEESGMFDEIYKKPIPRYIKTLGVVTAPTGAAIRDIINISTRRNPFIQIILYPAIVQGEEAAPSICRGIRMLDSYGTDVIIVGRGGGSLEDLWAFNEESVAEAVFACNTPIISAVGHETDTVISDYVADLRAPTPSAAAELAVDDFAALLDSISKEKRRMHLAMSEKIRQDRERVRWFQQRLRYLSPENRLREDRQHLGELEDRIRTYFDRNLQRDRHRLQLLAGRLSGLSPLEKLKSGYAYVRGEDGHAVTSVDRVRPGNRLAVYVTDGIIHAQVTDTEENHEYREDR